MIPVLFVRPVGLIWKSEQHGVKAGIILPAFEDIEGLLVYLPADAVAVGARCREEEPQRLLAGITGALRHDIVQCAGRLRMQLVKDAGGHVQTMLCRNLAGQYLIDGACGLVDHTLCRGNDFDSLHECRGLLDHIYGNVKHDGSLLPVCSAGVDFCFPLIIVDQHVQRDGSAQFALSVLFRDFNIG